MSSVLLKAALTVSGVSRINGIAVAALECTQVCQLPNLVLVLLLPLLLLLLLSGS
jgi:hypothetical protein